MKRNPAWIALLPLWLILSLTGCATGDFDYEEYYSIEDVADAWVEALYDWDEDYYLSLYWKDARISNRISEEEYTGIDGFLEYMDAFYEARDYDDFNIPEPEISEGADIGEVTFLFAYEGYNERLIVSRRGELWAVQEHLIEPMRPSSGGSAPQREDNSSNSQALTGKRIAVVGLDAVTESVNNETLSGLILFVENSFVNTGKVTVVDRKSIEKIVDEYSFQSTGLTDEETAVAIGKIAGAEIIVTGTLSSVGGRYYLQLRALDVVTAEVAASSLGEAESENDFLKMSGQAVNLLF